MKKNLIFFLARFGRGGAGNSVFKLCNNLDKNKYKISIICLNFCAYEKKLKENGVKVYKIKAKRILFTIFKLRKLIIDLTKKNKKNYLISNINYTNLLCAIFIKKNNNLKIIAIERTPFQELEIYFNFVDKLKKNIIKFLIPFFYKKFDLILCNSKHLGNYLKSKYKISSKTLFPPSLANFSKKKLFKKKNNKKYIRTVTVCRLSKEKNILEILNVLKSINYNIKLDIIGNGPEKKNIINQIRYLGLKKKIKLLGFKKNPIQFLKKYDLYINSSYFEGFPNSVVEAASAGVPIIASQSHGGINEILLKGKAGVIYKSPRQLKKNIINFIHNRKIFYTKAIIAKKNTYNFFLKTHVKKFEELINQI